jgi:ribose 1,5-bisphosphokinase PhnN
MQLQALICKLVVVVGCSGIGIDPLTICAAWAEINFRMGKSRLEQVVKRPAKPCSKVYILMGITFFFFFI